MNETQYLITKKMQLMIIKSMRLTQSPRTTVSHCRQIQSNYRTISLAIVHLAFHSIRSQINLACGRRALRALHE